MKNYKILICIFHFSLFIFHLSSRGKRRQKVVNNKMNNEEL